MAKPLCENCGIRMKVAYIRSGNKWKRVGWVCPECKGFVEPGPWDFIPNRKGMFRYRKPKTAI